MRRSHINAYEQRLIASKKFTHVSEVRTAAIVGWEYVRKCTHNVTILTCSFLNFLVTQAINFFCNANFDLIKVFYALSMFLSAKHFNLKCHHKLIYFTQAVGTTVDFAKGLWYQNGNATPFRLYDGNETTLLVYTCFVFHHNGD